MYLLYPTMLKGDGFRIAQVLIESIISLTTNVKVRQLSLKY